MTKLICDISFLIFRIWDIFSILYSVFSTFDTIFFVISKFRQMTRVHPPNCRQSIWKNILLANLLELVSLWTIETISISEMTTHTELIARDCLWARCLWNLTRIRFFCKWRLICGHLFCCILLLFFVLVRILIFERFQWRATSLNCIKYRVNDCFILQWNAYNSKSVNLNCVSLKPHFFNVSKITTTFVNALMNCSQMTLIWNEHLQLCLWQVALWIIPCPFGQLYILWFSSHAFCFSGSHHSPLWQCAYPLYFCCPSLWCWYILTRIPPLVHSHTLNELEEFILRWRSPKWFDSGVKSPPWVSHLGGFTLCFCRLCLCLCVCVLTTLEMIYVLCLVVRKMSVFERRGRDCTTSLVFASCTLSSLSFGWWMASNGLPWWAIARVYMDSLSPLCLQALNAYIHLFFIWIASQMSDTFTNTDSLVRKEIFFALLRCIVHWCRHTSAFVVT